MSDSNASIDLNMLIGFISPCRLLEVESEHILTYLSMFYLEFLSRVCMKSGLQGIVYNAGPRCTAKQEGKICGEVLPMIRHDLGDEDLPVVCDYCPASYSQEELSNLMKDWDLEVQITRYNKLCIIILYQVYILGRLKRMDNKRSPLYH